MPGFLQKISTAASVFCVPPHRHREVVGHRHGPVLLQEVANTNYVAFVDAHFLQPVLFPLCTVSCTPFTLPSSLRHGGPFSGPIKMSSMYGSGAGPTPLQIQSSNQSALLRREFLGRQGVGQPGPLLEVLRPWTLTPAHLSLAVKQCRCWLLHRYLPPFLACAAWEFFQDISQAERRKVPFGDVGLGKKLSPEWFICLFVCLYPTLLAFTIYGVDNVVILGPNPLLLQ